MTITQKLYTAIRNADTALTAAEKRAQLETVDYLIATHKRVPDRETWQATAEDRWAQIG